MSEVSTPRIYKSLGQIAAALVKQGLAKRHRNRGSGYDFRSIDDIYNILGPELVRRKVSLFPHMLEREQRELRGPAGELLISVTVHARFEFVSWIDGSSHSVESFGEAIDAGDKATAKAMTAAYKAAVIQSFCIPVIGEEDADATSPPRISAAAQEPEEGWAAWAASYRASVDACTSTEALALLQAADRERLRGLSRTQPDLFSEIGKAAAEKRAVLTSRPAQVAV